jgi:hypothetical protein
MRLRLTLMLLGALLVVATFTFPLWLPILENRGPAQAEAFPDLPAQLENAFLSLPQEQQRAYLAYDAQDHNKALSMVIVALSPRQPPPTEDQMMPDLNAPVTVVSGTFGKIDAVRWAQGTVNVYRDASNGLLLRLDGFSMQNGPDLHLYLSAADAPQNFAAMTTGDLAPLDVGALKTTYGSQNYTLPNSTDLTPLRSAVIYSTSLDLIYSYAPLFVRQ